MKLLIDAGNTRIKWALVNGDDWQQSGVFSVEQAGDLSQLFSGLVSGSQGIQQIWASNVAGENIARHIRNIKVGHEIGHEIDQSVQLHFVAARQVQCGVSNGYASTSSLGSDRWAALIAAWHQVQGGCLIVNSGTATTIDTLSNRGEFLGGLILPGVELMQRSLVGATAQLKSVRGEYAPYPRNTADALYSGAIQASCGAIERQYALLGDDSAPVILSGGAAGLLQPYLNQKLFSIPPRIVDNLVLQGLLLMAQEANA